MKWDGLTCEKAVPDSITPSAQWNLPAFTTTGGTTFGKTSYMDRLLLETFNEYGGAKKIRLANDINMTI